MAKEFLWKQYKTLQNFPEKKINRYVFVTSASDLKSHKGGYDFDGFPNHL